MGIGVCVVPLFAATILFPKPWTHQRTMDPIWEDINLSSLHDRSPATANLRGTSFKYFLAQTLEPPPPRSDAAPPPPATNLTLNSVSELSCFETLGTLRQESQMGSLNVSFDALSAGIAPASVAAANGRKRFPEPDKNSGDQKHRRLIKNRMSAARSRARKQAYTHELELEVAHLTRENARLKKQHQQLSVAAAAPRRKNHSLHRTSSAPF